MSRFELRYQDYDPTEDQLALIESFHGFLSAHCPPNVVRRAGIDGYDAALFNGLLQMGLAEMSLPEDLGGHGATLVELTLVAELAGAAMAPAPIASFLASLRLLATAAPGEAARALADAPERPCALALPHRGRPGSFVAAYAGLGGPVVGRAGEDIAVWPGSRPPQRDPGTLHRWSPQRTPTIIAPADAAPRLWDTAIAEWHILTAAMLIGLAQTALDDAVAFASERTTLGIPIGSLQGIAFPLADSATAVSSGRNLVRRAAWMTTHEPDTRPDLPAVAFAFAARTAGTVTNTAVQTQGGLGFLVDSPAGLYVPRAATWAGAGGDPQAQYRRIGAALFERVTSGGTR